MEISLDVEEALNEEIKGINSYRNATTFSRSGIMSRADVTRGSGGSSATSIASNARKETITTNKEARPGESTKNRGSRTLPYPEYVRRREEGRCFHCGGAYSPGHRCPEKNLRVIICAEEEG